jgi:hypothetical protein
LRTALAGAIGLIAGALLGLLAAFVFVYVWLEAGLPPWTDDPKSLDMLLICGAVGLFVGGATGAWWFARDDRRPPGIRFPMLIAVCLAAIVLAAVVALGW